jgi:hypothetical protein
MPFVFKDSGSGILTLSVGLMGKTICRGGGGVSASLASPVGVSASLGSGIVSLEGGSGGGGVSALVGEGLRLSSRIREELLTSSH